jgi:hypothetical protein
MAPVAVLACRRTCGYRAAASVSYIKVLPHPVGIGTSSRSANSETRNRPQSLGGEAMSKINVGRVVLGGLVSGLVINIIDFIVNVPILGARWDQALAMLRAGAPDAGGGSPIGWIISDFLFGILLVWIYASIRPRFGPGPRTAVIAALAVWAVSHIAYWSLAFLGLFPGSLVTASAVGAVVAYVVGGLVGCALYQEA